MERENQPNFIRRIGDSLEALRDRFQMRLIRYSQELLPLQVAEEVRISRILSKSDVVSLEGDEENTSRYGLFRVAERVQYWGQPANPDLLLYCPRIVTYNFGICWLKTTNDGSLSVINLEEGIVQVIPASEVREVVDWGRRQRGRFGNVISFLDDDQAWERPRVIVDPSYDGKTVIRIDILNSLNKPESRSDVAILDFNGRHTLKRKITGRYQSEPILIQDSSEVQPIST